MNLKRVLNQQNTVEKVQTRVPAEGLVLVWTPAVSLELVQSV